MDNQCYLRNCSRLTEQAPKVKNKCNVPVTVKDADLDACKLDFTSLGENKYLLTSCAQGCMNCLVVDMGIENEDKRAGRIPMAAILFGNFLNFQVFYSFISEAQILAMQGGVKSATSD